jgi:hypothetical protein
MKVFYKSFDANGQLEASLRLEDISDNDAYGIALTVYDRQYVEEMLDGKGWITIQNPKPHGGCTQTTYQQDSL